ncbi:MAG: PAS domain-containing protein, partial [Ktedonobacteraceae bacterium]|nr:PAS domain-containing protein [Ktedonobacteraceae bacterium]
MERDQKQEHGEIQTQPLVPRQQPMIVPPDTQPLENIPKADMPQQLPGSERHYRSLTSTTAQILWTVKADGTVDDIPLWRAYTGQTQQEIKGHGWLQAVHPDDVRRIYSEWQRALKAGQVFEIE